MVQSLTQCRNLNWDEVYTDSDPCTAYDTFLNILESQCCNLDHRRPHCLPCGQREKGNRGDRAGLG